MRIFDMRELGEQIRRQRERLDLNQSDAAGLTGVSVRLWSELERGQRTNVSFNTVLRILQTMSVDIDLVERGARSGAS